MENEKHSTRLRSYGRLASHMSAEDKDKLETRLEKVRCHLPEEENGKIDLESLFGRNSGKVIVELGMGNGEATYGRALKEPENNFIGCEVYKNGLKSLLVDIENHNIQNIRVCSDDGRELLESLPENSIDELVVLYPDPWPKKKHKKRRIVNAELLEFANKILKEDGVLFLATDIPDYALWMLREVYTQDIFFPTAISPEQWAKAPNWWNGTKYERKAFKQGRKPWYMEFKKGVDRSNTKCDTDETIHD